MITNLGNISESGGGGGTVTGANNGLSLNGTTAYLGGTLLQDTTVNQNGFNLNFTDATRGISIVNGDITIPTLGVVTLPALINDATPDYYITSPGSMIWIDQVGGIQSADVSVNGTSSSMGMNVSATQRNQFFVNSQSSELEIGDNTYGSTVSLAAMSLQNPSAGVYTSRWLARSGYTSDQDYTTTKVDLSQTEFIVSILEPTVAGVVGTPLNELTLSATGLTITDYPNTRDDSGTFTPTSFLYTGAGGQIYEAPLTYALPYLVYVAILSQTGTDNPTVTVLQNTIGSIVWTRNTDGDYTGTLLGAFTADSTFFLINSPYYTLVNAARLDANSIGISVSDVSTNTQVDNISNISIEIRVY